MDEQWKVYSVKCKDVYLDNRQMPNSFVTSVLTSSLYTPAFHSSN